MASIRRLTLALALCCTLAGSSSAAFADSLGSAPHGVLTNSQPSPKPTEEERHLAKTRFAVDAGLAAGATYKFIVEPYKAGKFKKGHPGRTTALVKAGIAGVFAYDRLKAAKRNAAADPALSKLLAPLGSGIEGLKDLPHKFHSSKSGDSDAAAQQYQSIIDKVKDAGAHAGAPVKDQVPSAQQLMSSP